MALFNDLNTRIEPYIKLDRKGATVLFCGLRLSKAFCSHDISIKKSL